MTPGAILFMAPVFPSVTVSTNALMLVRLYQHYTVR